MCQRGNCDGGCAPKGATDYIRCIACGGGFWVFDGTEPDRCQDCQDDWDAADDAADRADHENKGERE